MKQWEFLLQKDGDRSWLPLDSPEVEILAGRYRIVVRSSLVNTPVEIRITHLMTDTDPPKRRIQKRSSRTNSQGLMVLIPFTSLQPGVWQLQCSVSDLMADLLNPESKRAVQLQVLPQESDRGDWESDWLEPEADEVALPVDPLLEAPQTPEPVSLSAIALPLAAAPESVPSWTASPNEFSLAETFEVNPELPELAVPELAVPELAVTEAHACEMTEAQVVETLATIAPQPWLQLTEELSEQLMTEVLGDFDLAKNAGDSEPIENLPLAAPEMSQIAAASGFLLQLDRDTLAASNGEELTLSGWIETTAPAAAAEEFQLCLRDPQTQRVLVNDRHPLVGQTYGFPFFLTVTLPAELDTRLIQGELRLWGIPLGADLAIVLANQAFTITVNPTALVREFDQIHASLSEQSGDAVLAGVPHTAAAPLLELSFLERDSSPVAVARSQPLSLPGSLPVRETETVKRRLLPPPLQTSIGTKSARKALDLPAFGRALDESRESPVSAIAPPVSDTERAAIESSDSGFFNSPSSDRVPEPMSALEAGLPPGVEPLEASLPEQLTVLIAPPNPLVLGDADLLPSDTTEIVAPCPTQSAFRSLNLQARFLDRLTLLASDPELPALLRARSARTSNGRAEAGSRTPPLAPASAQLGQEIVIHDEPLAVQPPRRRVKRAADLDSTCDRSEPTVLPDEQPVPIPELQITTGELVAGQPVNIRVRLPDGMPRIYVKLWINDRQTRTLMDGPRWLVDFLPNGHGALEALTQLTVPFGSLDIRFEAIAIEMHTQRESRKMTVDRSVVPPDLPALSLYEFEV